MNWEAIGAAAELLAALAVIATIAYLAAQIRQANKISKTNTVTELQARFDAINSTVVNNPELRSVLRKKPPLTDDEVEQVYSFAHMSINVWASVQNAYDNDQIDQALYTVMMSDVRVAIQRWPNFKDAIDQFLSHYPESKDLEIWDQLHRTEPDDA